VVSKRATLARQYLLERAPARAIDAIEQRLAIVLPVAEGSLENNPNRAALRVY
jgi:hypothetical protein